MKSTYTIVVVFLTVSPILASHHHDAAAAVAVAQAEIYLVRPEETSTGCACTAGQPCECGPKCPCKPASQPAQSWQSPAPQQPWLYNPQTGWYYHPQMGWYWHPQQSYYHPQPIPAYHWMQNGSCGG
jgi:hypothetical protein